jgi:energy-coupling factor transporter ATP-binding protein EcfA2
MVRLTRLRIDRFRNVKPGTELRFGPTFNVLLGKNATGKSTLLDLVAAVTNDDLSAYAKEDAGFDLTWWLEKAEDQIEVHAVRTPAKSGSLSERVREEKEFDDVWTMVLRSKGIEAGRLMVTGTRGSWAPVGETEEPFDVRSGLGAGRAGMRALLAVSDKHLVETPAVAHIRAAANMLGFLGRVSRFDEALTALSVLTRSPFELSREGSGGSGSFSDWLPRDVITTIDEPTSSDAFVVSFDKLRSLAEIPARLGFSSAELRPRMLRRSQSGERVTTLYHGFDCLFRRADGSQISHELLSFGQKRLVSVLWYLAVRGELPVVADELLNGLHHEWIEVCFERLRERQSFLATQHPCSSIISRSNPRNRSARPSSGAARSRGRTGASSWSGGTSTRRRPSGSSWRTRLASST